MAETLTKLRPDHDLQCYFQRPSAVAALSEASANGFTVSGCWREQFDWAVVEWNRDNVFDHPALRNLPDGDLSGLHLSYQEIRTNCIPFDSALYPTVDWPYLRIWAESGGTDTLHHIPLKNYASPATSDAAPATVTFELQGTVTAGDYIELAWLDQHFNYQVGGGDTVASAAQSLAAVIGANQTAGKVTATASGATITLTYLGMPGSNGNRVGVYGTVHGAATESWLPAAAMFSGGASASRWQVSLDFSNLHDMNGALVPTTNVRKMRWTWAADLQPGNFVRGEFSVLVSNWSITGTGAQYFVAGPGSRRIEDDGAIHYQGAWAEGRGNFSGGSIRWTITPGASISCTYQANGAHWLYLGTRRADAGGQVTVQVDGGSAVTFGLHVPAEDVLVRIPIGQFSGSAQHTVSLTYSGTAGSYFYFDFLEIAYPSSDLPEYVTMPTTTLATDWDTDHSLALPAERTAWLMQKLGFKGRSEERRVGKECRSRWSPYH